MKSRTIAVGLSLSAFAVMGSQPGFAQVPPTPREYAGYTGLFAAAARNDTTRISKLIAQGEYAGMRDAHGRTPLHVAAYKRRHDAMRVLSSATGDPNVLDADGYDITTIAAAAGDPETLRVALAIGCSPRNVTGPDQSSALIAAIANGDGSRRYVVTVKMLLAAGANVSASNSAGATPLTLARARGQREIVAMLEKAGAR
jgi:ankyrin repeat protein